MVAHLVAHDRTILELQKQDDMKWTILHFYFDFRGGKGINNSFEGLLRSLLYQLVEAIPQLDVKDVDDGKSGRFSDWSERRLRTVLRTSLENATGGVCIFVDGLDEYEGDDVLELIQFLKSLAPSKDSRRTSIKVCVSSRPEAIPSQLLGHLPNLSMSDYNESGIRSYCLRTLEGLEPEVRKDLDMLRLSRIMANRAEGVFLWARFALDEVVQGHFSGENFDEILVRLRSIPLELEDVYDRMLSRIEPTAKQECMIMLQLVCFAKRELSWQELLVAVNTAMDKDVVFSEIPCDKDPAYAPKVYDTFAKRLRAKAVGLLEIIKIEHWEKRSGKMVMVMVEALKLIHRSVSTYLNQKGWQTLGALKGEASIGAESLYVETCTRYLQCLLRHCKMENETIQRIRKWLQGKVFYNVRSDLIRTSAGIYPFFAYAACYVFKHAASLERHGSSSYPLFHDALTEQLVSLIITCQAKSEYYTPSSLSLVPDLLLKDFDAIFVAFLHGLVLYCTNDLATRSPAPGQVFWERALRCALLGEAWQLNSNTKTLSLALQNVVTVKQIHLEEAVSSESLELVLQHDSVRRLRLVDRKGQAVTLPWLFNKYIGFDSLGKILNLLIERGNDRGEDVRQRWSPERNLVETLMKQSPNPERAEKLRTLRKYYESRSWPFEYDPRETERFYDSDDIDRE